MGAFGKFEPGADVAGLRLNLVNFVHKNNGIHHYGVTYYIYGVFPENAGRHGMENETISVEMERVPGVGASLKTCRNFIVGGQYIDHFSFALITPLEPEDYIYFAHTVGKIRSIIWNMQINFLTCRRFCKTMFLQA